MKNKMAYFHALLLSFARGLTSMRWIYSFLGVAAALFLSACTPGDVQYCRGLGVNEQSPEYGACTQYYHQQNALFGSDLSRCSMDADLSYPPILYDVGRSALVPTFDPYSGFRTMQRVDIPPDPFHNAQVDALRAQIIHPCMNAHGWNSPYTWQAGRHVPLKKQRHATQPAVPKTAPLPWLQ